MRLSRSVHLKLYLLGLRLGVIAMVAICPHIFIMWQLLPLFKNNPNTQRAIKGNRSAMAFA